MRAKGSRTRQLLPTRVAAAAAALALFATPVPAHASDAQRTSLLTTTGGMDLSELEQRVVAIGGTVVQTLELSSSLIVELPHGVGAPSGSTEVPDVPVTTSGAVPTHYDTTAPTYQDTIGSGGEPDAGQGVTVAVLDTGVADVPDLAHVEHINVSGGPQGDGLGHGTFLAGIIGGRGQFPGVAPGATLVDVQVADASGETSLSRVLSGLERVAERGDVDVLNVSLATESPLPPPFDPLSRALERLWESGVTVVVSAGNGGPGPGTVSAPGNDPLLLTVGALDEGATSDRGDDRVADFSARGSGQQGSKPDLIAPGVSLVSTSAPDSLAVQENPQARVTADHMRGSGTSMAAAVVTGAAAVVLQTNPDLGPDAVKALLTGTAYSSTGIAPEDGAGLGGLDLTAAVAAAPTAQSVSEAPTAAEGCAQTRWGPAEDEAESWATLAAAWDADDLDTVQAVWAGLTPQTQKWASRAWAMAVLAESVDLPEEEFQARSWSARSWSARSWHARSWSSDAWLAQAWSARSWSSDAWLARSWSARSWSEDAWSARSWSWGTWGADATPAEATAWASPEMTQVEQAPDPAAATDPTSAEATPAETTPAETTPAEQTPTEEDPAPEPTTDPAPAEATNAEETSAEDVPADETATDEAPADETPAETTTDVAGTEDCSAAGSWGARSWSARSWSARSWSARSWSARSWSARSWSARSWSARSWSARSWSTSSWS